MKAIATQKENFHIIINTITMSTLDEAETDTIYKTHLVSPALAVVLILPYVSTPA
jgi:flagellar biosynthesis GTPase FlhF